MTGGLAGIVVFCLCAGRTSGWAAAGAALLAAALLWGHGHGVLAVDGYAHRSPLSAWNPELKLAGSLTLTVLCAVSRSPWPPLLLAASLGTVTVWGGKVGLRRYLALLRLPAAFLLLSALALLWDWSPVPEGVLRLPFLGGWLVVTPSAQAAAGAVLARAAGAVSCLYFLSLSTPLPELMEALRRLHVPGIVVDLAVLIYRYVFLLLTAWHQARAAAASRLGYGGLRQSLRTTGAVYGNLLAAGLRRAGACYDAMESRCYDGDIRFLERSAPVRPAHLLAVAGAVAAMGWMTIWM